MKYLIQIILACMLVCAFFVFSGCEGTQDSLESPDSASVSVNVQWPDETAAPGLTEWRASSDGAGGVDAFMLADQVTLSDHCSEVDSVVVSVKNSSGGTLKSGSFACSAKQGTLSGITPQSGCTIVVSARDSGNKEIYRGEKTGVHLYAGDNGPFSIKVSKMSNTPPTATITSPSDGSTYETGDLITFVGTGTDAEDGDVLGSTFVWTSSLDGQIQSGRKSFSTNGLSTGTHTITLTVTDSDGAEGTDSITIIIIAVSRITFNKLPDTGQTESYTATFGEDSDYTINPPSYTKLDDTGTALGDNAASWSMVKDNVTGLIWEVKTDDGSIHDRDKEYTWQDAQDSFIAALNNSRFGGYSDWRMPSIMELSTIVDAGTYDPAIDTDFFPNTQSSYYWSSTTLAGNTDGAWLVNFHYGSVILNNKSFTYDVRAVRGGQ